MTRAFSARSSSSVTDAGGVTFSAEGEDSSVASTAENSSAASAAADSAAGASGSPEAGVTGCGGVVSSVVGASTTARDAADAVAVVFFTAAARAALVFAVPAVLRAVGVRAGVPVVDAPRAAGDFLTAALFAAEVFAVVGRAAGVFFAAAGFAAVLFVVAAVPAAVVLAAAGFAAVVLAVVAFAVVLFAAVVRGVVVRARGAAGFLADVFFAASAVSSGADDAASSACPDRSSEEAVTALTYQRRRIFSEAREHFVTHLTSPSRSPPAP